MNAQILEGHWTELKGRLKERWGTLTNDELDQAEGDLDQLIGLVQRRTGEAKEAVEHFIERIYNEVCQPSNSSTKEAAQRYARQAAEGLEQATKQVRDSLENNLHGTEQLIRERPIESIAVVFGAGLLAGVVAGVLLRGK